MYQLKFNGHMGGPKYRDMSDAWETALHLARYNIFVSTAVEVIDLSNGVTMATTEGYWE